MSLEIIISLVLGDLLGVALCGALYALHKFLSEWWWDAKYAADMKKRRIREERDHDDG